MLEGIAANEIIAGAYANRDGVCPMLAAHRAGGRTAFLSFARSWDRFARADGKPRAASEREVRILVRQLEASLADDGGLEFDVAIAQHRELVSRGRRARRALTETADPQGEIIARRLRGPWARAAQTASPGRMKMISGTRQAGEVLTR